MTVFLQYVNFNPPSVVCFPHLQNKKPYPHHPNPSIHPIQKMPPPPSPQNQNQNQAYFNTVLNASPHQQQPSSRPSPSTRPPPPLPTTTLTASQRSAQARAKPLDGGGESYERQKKREDAVRIVEDLELLVWWSGARNEVRCHITCVSLPPIPPPVPMSLYEGKTNELIDYFVCGIESIANTHIFPEHCPGARG
ncbi:hypothetical protein CC80DRAFT_487466 [Byssothecium circinans]|uniref:Uncharacterized protein n=1 Tax=Byssothecium circinans TaxID=147558 RepID=A0A6A5UE69_9PLEO|nr:hypothetical protein CC80DRAFT_487466 [Byssothecium circinans]